MPVVADQPEHGDEQHQPDRGPGDLPVDQLGGQLPAQRRGLVDRGEVQPVDHHQAQPVEQRDAGQDQRVGVGREPAHREVRHGEQGQVGRADVEQRRPQLLLLVGLDEHQRPGDQQRGERQQHQLDAAPGGQRRRGGRTAPVCRCVGRGHQPTGRQVVPGWGGTVGTGVVSTGGGWAGSTGAPGSAPPAAGPGRAPRPGSAG